LLVTNEIGLALSVAIYALVMLYLLHSFALLMLPRWNPALFHDVTVAIPIWLQRVAGVVSILFMATMLTQISLFAVELLLFWAAIGLLLYAWSRRVANRGTAGGIEDAEEPKLG
jgi:hypothetical protein